MGDDISMDEMWRRLKLNNPALVGKALGYSEAFWNQALMIKNVIDEKAQRNFQHCALCLTLLLTLGTFLAKANAPFTMPVLFALVFMCGAACFVGAAICFFRVNGNRQYYHLTAGEILHPEVLSLADEKDGPGVAAYERNMTRHFLDLGMAAGRINAEKARMSKRGERFFIAGLLGIALDLFLLALNFASP